MRGLYELRTTDAVIVTLFCKYSQYLGRKIYTLGDIIYLKSFVYTKYLGVFMYCGCSQYSEILYVEYCRTRSISGFNVAAEYCCTSRSSAFCRVLEILLPLVLRVPRARGGPTTCAVHPVRSTHEPSEHVSTTPSPPDHRKHARMVPRVGVEANPFRGRRLECLIVLSVFRECTLRVLAKKSIRVRYSWVLTTISDICAAGTARTRGFAQLIRSIIPNARSTWAFRTADTSNTIDGSI